MFPGSDLVARFAGVVLFAVPTSARGEVVDELLRIAAATGSQPGDRGRWAPRQAVALLYRDDGDEPPSFALAAQAPRGVAMIVSGEVVVTLIRQDGEERLSGTSASTWLDRMVEGDVEAIVVTRRGSAPAARDGRANLRSGVVPGAGFALTRSPSAGEPVAAAPPDPTVFEPIPAEVAPSPPVEEVRHWKPAPLAADPDDRREPLPILGEQPPAEPVGDDAIEVDGVLCSRGHFNDPNARFCAVCGIGMLQLTTNPVKGPRPPLGYLVVDDGSTFSLDCDYLVGRSPEDNPDVKAGRARPLILSDESLAISRVHARIVLDKWEVKIVDLSTNGTALARPGEAEAVRLSKLQEERLSPGTRVVIGQRSLTFDSHSRT